jgi:hypothetical protein
MWITFRIMQKTYTKIRRLLNEIFCLYLWYVLIHLVHFDDTFSIFSTFGSFWYVDMPRRIFGYKAIPSEGHDPSSAAHLSHLSQMRGGGFEGLDP